MEKKINAIKTNLESKKQKDINFGVKYALEFLPVYENENKSIKYGESFNYNLIILKKKINFSVLLLEELLFKISFKEKDKENIFFIDLNDLKRE